ncbi:MAG: M43 family zinc metalloprotease [Flavobacteriales bacterium]|nr:M43 family zinc metalloprotease [Flavobacteriales bacterium]
MIYLKNCFYSLLISTLFFPLTLSSQYQFSNKIDPANCRSGEKIEFCRTHHVMNKLKSNPAYMKGFIKDQMEMQEQELKIKSGSRQSVVYTIPVVFHVLHDGGPENISKAQIDDAMFILNRDYNLQNSDANNVQSVFQGMPSDVQLEFKLATKAPNGQCFSGVTRTQNAISNNGSDGSLQVSAIISGNNVYNNPWAGNRYLNIFVCGEIGGAAGYTTNPSAFTGSSMYNGIWVLHDYVGSMGTSSPYSSRTLTHEVGHWLNLDHTWSDNNNPGNASSCNDDDNCDDTPRCIGVSSCNLTSNTCSNDAVDGYWSSDVVDNVENYMDYSYCSKMFTDDQKNRMRSALNSNSTGRKNLWSTSNLSYTGANATPTLCAADFYAERQEICKGNSIQFFDASYNNASGWSWSFPGATPSVSTSQNPTVTYTSSGEFDVTLQVNDPSGNIQSKTMTNYIYSLPVPGKITPIEEGFENVSSIPNIDWSVVNGGGPGFEITNNASSGGSKSVKLDNSSGANLQFDELISSTVNLSNLASATLSFKYAFAKISSSNTDYLQILVSNDCGENWFVRKTLSPATIATMGNTTSNISPTGSDWKSISVPSLVSIYLVNDFRFKFKFVNGGGNDLYIDDINLSGPLSLRDNEKINDFYVFPNPARNELNVSFNLLSQITNASVLLVDALGREIKTINNASLNIGHNQFTVDLSSYPSGFYFVKIDSQERKLITKFIKN